MLLDCQPLVGSVVLGLFVFLAEDCVILYSSDPPLPEEDSAIEWLKVAEADVVLKVCVLFTVG